MSRTTQYIGLTKQAMNFLADYERVENSDNHTKGMFDEVVSLGEWVLNYDGAKFHKAKFHKIKEIVQAEPWSGGPMIFTCLVGFFHNDKNCEHPVLFLGWVEDPRIENEYNREKGLFWV